MIGSFHWMVLFLRHCESIFNATGVDEVGLFFYLTVDCDLSEFGIQQAKQLSLGVVFDVIFCSPLKRCLSTLKYSSIQYKECKVENIFREYKLNHCDFLENEDFSILETESELQERVDKIKEYLKELNAKENSILIISHSDLIWNITKEKKEEEYFGKWLKNGEIINISME
jgi:broad specificity phosphatase PhoE